MALQFLGDLLQPLGLGDMRSTLSQKHRLQGGWIIRQGLGQHRHGRD
jgi:hypothetical protein